MRKFGIRSDFVGRFATIVGRMACVLAALTLLCTSVAQGQIIEEGFPVKGGGVSGEAFSLSCPSRLMVQAGSSIVLSCSAAAVPEEGIRYEWESLSGGGLDFLSASDELAPLFTVPFSGAGEEYAYRLTAMSVGVYETADVTVVVEGFPGDGARGRGGDSAGPGGCDTFAFTEGDRAGCASKGEGSELFSPFEGFPGEEGDPGFPFPDSPGAPEEGLPGLSGAGDPAQQTAPYLDCPLAVFLEELEVGSIECHVSDALGEEFLEYMWEPVGSTTRDYLDNPRLIPEDSPYPLVVAPEAPRYETLEASRSGETTFRYRYRLTATSRATGLFSSSEVEVFVSSNRPGVFCPLEVVVEEGSTVTLDCEGVDPLSSRMDYDEDGASIEWEWEGLWGTSMSLLDATDLSSPLFTAPAGSAGKQYHYIASMTSSSSGKSLTARRRMTVTVTGREEGEQDAADGDALADTGSAPVVTCEDIDPVYEGADDIELDCSVTDEPSDPAYAWTTRGSTSDTDDLTNTDSLRATFSVPEDINEPNGADKDYEYTVTLSATGIDAVTEDVTVTVLEKPDIWCRREYHGAPELTGGTHRIEACPGGWANAPDSDYMFKWIGVRTVLVTPEDALARLDQTNVASPLFSVPTVLPTDEWVFYTYNLMVSATNADPFTLTGIGVTVSVENRPALSVACDDPADVYEGDPGFALNCEPDGAWPDFTYTWQWSPTDNLTDHDTATPTFAVPDTVNQDTTYEYTARVSAQHHHPDEATVTVTVKDTTPAVTCENIEVYEKATAHITLDCSVANEPAGATYAWTTRGSTSDTSLLTSGANTLTPTFAVPEDINEPDEANKDYEYTVTLSAGGADVASADITVTVLEKPNIILCSFHQHEISIHGGYEGNSRGEARFSQLCPDGPHGAPEIPPGTPPVYTYVWSTRDSTPDTALVYVTSANMTVWERTYVLFPEVTANTIYKYRLTISAPNADEFVQDLTLHVLNKPRLKITCANTPYELYEGDDDFSLNCEAKGWGGWPITYKWTARGATPNTDLLIAGKDGPTPTFAVPDSVDATMTYEYTLTASMPPTAKDGALDVTVTVKDTGTDIVVRCRDSEVYAGAADFMLNCTVANEPSGATYSWAARGGTSDTSLLTGGVDTLTPTLSVPGSVSMDKIYEYTVTLSADGVDDVDEDIAVRVKARPDIAVSCPGNPYRPDEGDSDITLNCSASGAPPGSSYAYVWTARGNTPDTALLIAGSDGPTPTFDVPPSVIGHQTYEYTLTVSAENANSDAFDVMVTVRDKDTPAVTCDNPEVYEGAADFMLNCTVANEPSGATYSWAARGGTSDTSLLTGGVDTLTPTFSVPGSVSMDKIYEYTVTLSASSGIGSVTADVTVTVIDTNIDVECYDHPYMADEGDDDITLDCEASGAPGDTPLGPDPSYVYVWTARGTTADTALLIGDTNGPAPMFDVPLSVDEDETYEYRLTVSADNAQDGAFDVTVKVKNTVDPPVVTCNSTEVFEGASGFPLACSVQNEPSGATYSWAALGGTSDTSLLIVGENPLTPTFSVPDNVNADTDYEYRVTLSASGIADVTADVTVRVLNKQALSVSCASVSPVFEGSPDFDLDCVASGAPAGSEYDYVWTAQGTTSDTALLTGDTNGPTPTFAVPGSVDEDETYEYLLTVSAENAEDAEAPVTVTVLNKKALSVSCAPVSPVFEGSPGFDLDCVASGAPAGSEYDYVWTARGSTSDTALLIAGADGPTPTFAVPGSVDEDETHEYLLTVSAENAEDAEAPVTVTVLNKKALSVSCAPVSPVFEGSPGFDLDCVASGAPAGSEYDYVWTARGSTSDTALLIAGADGATPTFAVPGSVDEDETYEYLLTVSAENAEDATAEITVTVLNLGVLNVSCASPPLAYEGSVAFTLDCMASGALGDNPTYVWTPRGSTSDTALLIAGTDGPTPTFEAPGSVDEDETYEYLLTVTAENAVSASAEVAVTVLNKKTLNVSCASLPLVYEGSEDFAFDCSVSGAPAGSTYDYAWTARGSTPDTALLTDANSLTPTFLVPDELPGARTFEYLLTVSAGNAESGSAAVTVTVLNRGALAVSCVSPPLVYEGSADFALDCSASGAPAGSTYDYVWTPRGSTPDTALLTDANSLTPTFLVPDELPGARTFEYLLTVSAGNAESGSAAVTVTVLNRGALAVVCTETYEVYEGSEDFSFDCSVSGAPAGSDYSYVWTARGNTADTALLMDSTPLTPTFLVPDDLPETTTYEYLLTVSAENAEDATAEVTVTVLNQGALRVVCTDPPSVYEGSADIMLDCSASGAPAGSAYAYAWTARGNTSDTSLLSSVDIASPTFLVPDEVNGDETYEYLLAVSAADAESAEAEVTVTVLNRGALSVTCADPPSVYEGSEDFALDCSASGAPSGSAYAYAWTARGETSDTSLLSSVDIASPTFLVPDEVNGDETYEYLLAVSAADAESAEAEVTVTVLNRGALSVTCADPPSVYEGSEDFALDCSASGAPSGSAYAYAWTARGETSDTSLLSSVDIASPTFLVPDDLPETATYEYLLTASAANAEDASAGVSVTVMHPAPLAFTDDSIAGGVYVLTVGETIEDIALPGANGGFPPYAYALSPALPEGLALDDPTRTISGTPLEVSPRTEYVWQATDANSESISLAFFIEVVPAAEPTSPPVAESLPEAPEPSALGVTVSTSSLRFGVQSADTEASLDPLTDQLSTYISGPYHAGRMTLAPGGGEALDENGEMNLSIELASPVVLKRADGIEAVSLVLSPNWSFAESCEQLSSQAIGGLYTEVTLSEDACRLLRFGGELDLTDVLPGRYAGNLDIILRSGEREETHSVEVDVTVIPAQQVITIGPGGVRFSMSRELPAGLTEEQNLSIYPNIAFMTGEKPNGVFELSNPSLVPLEVTVSARFGYTEMTADGREVVVEDASGSHLGDLSQVVDIRPGVLVLMPGAKSLVRYGIEAGALAAMADKGYAAFFDVVSSPRQYVRTDRMPEEVTGERTARVTMRVPGVYVPGEAASQLRATLLSISYVGSLSATFLLETADHPFVGEVLAYDGEGRELGRRETLVYTRSRVRIPLDRIPEGGAVFLRFAPRGSDRVPLPVSVEWDAPRRDIGEAEKKEKTPTTATVAGRP